MKNSINHTGFTFGCSHCGKYYKTRVNLNKHQILCETLTRAKKSKRNNNNNENEEFLEPLPSQKQMYKIILDLALKCNHLEEKMEEMQKWVDKKKKKINVIDWLNNQYPTLNITFEQFKDSIIILKEETELILHHPFLHVFTEILNRIFNQDQDQYQSQMKDQDQYQNQNQMKDQIEKANPLFAFTQKSNTIYIYCGINNADEYSWKECSKEQIAELFKDIHFKLVKSFIEWKMTNQEKINASDSLSELYNKANIKIMDINFKEDAIFQKAKSILYNKIKMDMKALIEYEFEF
jgi:hypothetical protein